jgi:hypothetical protein
MLSQSSCNNKSSRVFSFLSVCQRDSSALLPSVERELSATNFAILCLTCLSREIVQRVSGKARDSSSEIVDKFGMQWIWWKKSHCNSRMLSSTMQFFETSTWDCNSCFLDSVWQTQLTLCSNTDRQSHDHSSICRVTITLPQHSWLVYLLSLSLSLSIKRLAYCGIGRVNLSDSTRNVICCNNALLWIQACLFTTGHVSWVP